MGVGWFETGTISYRMHVNTVASTQLSSSTYTCNSKAGATLGMHTACIRWYAACMQLHASIVWPRLKLPIFDHLNLTVAFHATTFCLSSTNSGSVINVILLSDFWCTDTSAARHFGGRTIRQQRNTAEVFGHVGFNFGIVC